MSCMNITHPEPEIHLKDAVINCDSPQDSEGNLHHPEESNK